VGAERLEEEARPLRSRVRAFFGLPLPEEHRHALARYIAQCESIAPDFRWVPAANLHLTVRFIGSVDRKLVEDIADRLPESQLAAFEIALGDLGTFKRGRLVRVAWLGLLSGVEAAQGLAARVEAACAAAGLEAETRPFQPHLTLARARARLGSALPGLPDAPKLRPWKADELVLYQSHLTPKGSVYEPLRTLRMN
jgi:2'-5' RNA ligase